MSLTETDDRPTAHAGPPPARGRPRPEAAPDGDGLALALRRLNRFALLDDGDSAIVLGGLGPLAEHRTGADLGDDGDETCSLLVSGWACRVSDTPWGGRQILDFVLPGDPIGLSVRPKLEGLYRVVALSRGATVDARKVRERLRADGAGCVSLRRACRAEELATARRMILHTNRLGGVSATQAMAHLLLELRGRLAEVDLLVDGRFPFLLSQENLHDALGITSTQVYRILSQMRKDRLIALGPGWAEIDDPAALAAAAGLKQWRA